MTTLKSALCIDCNFKFLYFKVVFYRHMSAEGCVGWDCFKNGVGDERFPNHLHKLVHFLMHYFSSSFFSHILLPHPFLPFSVGKGVRCKMTLRSSGWDKYLLSRKKNYFWLVWLSELSTGLRTKRLPVQFPVRAHAWVSGRVPGLGHVRGNPSIYLLSFDLFIPLFLPSFTPIWK